MAFHIINSVILIIINIWEYSDYEKGRKQMPDELIIKYNGFIEVIK